MLEHSRARAATFTRTELPQVRYTQKCMHQPGITRGITSRERRDICSTSTARVRSKHWPCRKLSDSTKSTRRVIGLSASRLHSTLAAALMLRSHLPKYHICHPCVMRTAQTTLTYRNICSSAVHIESMLSVLCSSKKCGSAEPSAGKCSIATAAGAFVTKNADSS